MYCVVAWLPGYLSGSVSELIPNAPVNAMRRGSGTQALRSSSTRSPCTNTGPRCPAPSWKTHKDCSPQRSSQPVLGMGDLLEEELLFLHKPKRSRAQSWKRGHLAVCPQAFLCNLACLFTSTLVILIHKAISAFLRTIPYLPLDPEHWSFNKSVIQHLAAPDTCLPFQHWGRGG